LSADAFSHTPFMVTTGASGATFETSVSLLWAGFIAPPAGALDCPAAGVGVELAAWPQAMAASIRQTKAYRVIFNDSSKKIEKITGNPSTEFRRCRQRLRKCFQGIYWRSDSSTAIMLSWLRRRQLVVPPPCAQRNARLRGVPCSRRSLLPP
jgi:hypothetical protein